MNNTIARIQQENSFIYFSTIIITKNCLQRMSIQKKRARDLSNKVNRLNNLSRSSPFLWNMIEINDYCGLERIYVSGSALRSNNGSASLIIMRTD